MKYIVANLNSLVITLVGVALLPGCEPFCTITGLPGAWQQDFDFEIGKGQSILPLRDGGYLIIGVGSPHGAIAPNLLRTDSAGREVWANYTSDPIFPGSMLENDDASILLVGSSREQENVALLDGDGDVIWSRLLGESAQTPPSLSRLVATSDGNYATISHSHLPRTVSVVKFDTEASPIWTSTLDLADGQYVQGIVPTADGGVTVLTSTFLRRLADDGTTVWSIVLPPAFVDNAFLTGTDNDGVSVLGDNRLARYDRDGNEIWNRAYASTIGTEPIDFRATPDGGFVVGSSTYSYANPSVHVYCQNMVLTKLDGNGDIAWEREYGTESISFLDAVAPTSDGGYIILGSRVSSYFSSWSFMFLMKIDGE